MVHLQTSVYERVLYGRRCLHNRAEEYIQATALDNFTYSSEKKRKKSKRLMNKNDVMRLGERPRSLEGKPNITGTDRD